MIRDMTKWALPLLLLSLLAGCGTGYKDEEMKEIFLARNAKKLEDAGIKNGFYVSWIAGRYMGSYYPNFLPMSGRDILSPGNDRTNTPSCEIEITYDPGIFWDSVLFDEDEIVVLGKEGVLYEADRCVYNIIESHSRIKSDEAARKAILEKPIRELSILSNTSK